MASLTVMGYLPGDTFLHRLDPRFKLLFLVLISLTSLRAPWWGLLLLAGVALGCLLRLGPPLFPLVRETRFFLLLLMMVLAARALLTPGQALFTAGPVSLSREGVHDGLLVAARLFLVALAGLLLMLSTKSAGIKAAAAWALGWIPWVPAGRVAMMLGLMVRFIPLVFDKAAEIQAAQRARGVEGRRNPLFRITCLVLPLMRKSFRAGDDLALAMEARCYAEDRTGPRLQSRPRDWLCLGMVLGLCGAALAGIG